MSPRQPEAGEPEESRLAGFVPVARLRHPRLATFSINTGGQGHTPASMELYLNFLSGREKVEWDGGTGWVAAKVVELYLDAPDYTQTKQLQDKNITPSASKWRITPNDGSEFLDGPVLADQRIEKVLVQLVADPDVAQPRVPVVNAFIPDTPGDTSVHAKCTDGAAETPASCQAVIEAFLRGCLVDKLDGINLGSATLVWKEPE
ncbi:MAG: hypothetical protein ABSC06_11375 [Rhodopila sp.]